MDLDGFTPSASGLLTKPAQTLSQARAADVLSNWRLTPATMMAHLDQGWIPAKWLQYLSFKIAQCVARGNCGLLISAPPRHGKSQLSTIATPLWTLENFPHKNVVVSTYGEELSSDFSRQIRDLIMQNQDILNVRLRADTRRVTNFLTTEGGGLKAVGLRGAITGRGADVFVLDDYIKEPKEALSPTYLEDLYTWYLTVARTRLEPGAVVIILATRWVSNDLHGRIMKRQKETGRNFFEYVELPAIADDLGGARPDPIGRLPGEVLFPERYNRTAIYDIKTELGARWFNAMFQQRPEDDEGRVLNPEWFKAITRAEFDRELETIEKGPHASKSVWVRCWDLASTKEAGDFTSGAFCFYNKVLDRFYIVNIARGQWSSNRVEMEFVKTVESDYKATGVVAYKIGIEQEPGSSGAYTINHFQGLARKAVAGTKIYEHRATTSKLLNAQPLLAAAEAGKVFVVCDYDEQNVITGWAKDMYAELEYFPEAENDDQVDSLSQAYKLATGRTFKGATFGRKGPKAGETPANDTDVIKKRTKGATFGRRQRLLPGNWA
jgi:predicted phage terminase large subunit-like protein